MSDLARPVGPVARHLRERFGYHPSTPVTIPLHVATRTHFAWLAQWVDENVPDSRERNLAQTALQEAAMWSNAAIAILAPLEEVTP